MSDNVFQKAATILAEMLGINIYDPIIRFGPIDTTITIRATTKKLSPSTILYLIEKLIKVDSLDIDIDGAKFKIKFSFFPVTLNNMALGRTQLPFQVVYSHNFRGTNSHTYNSFDEKNILALAQKRIKFKGINSISITYWIQRGGELHDETE